MPLSEHYKSLSKQSSPTGGSSERLPNRILIIDVHKAGKDQEKTAKRSQVAKLSPYLEKQFRHVRWEE